MGNSQASSHLPESTFQGKSRLYDRPVFHIALIALLGLLAYINTFNVPFQFDDYVIDIRQVGDVSRIPSLFTDIRGNFGSRPLLLATISLNYYFGGVNVWGYHAVNLALHLINGVLLYFLVLMTGRLLGYANGGVRPAALLASLLFVVHPVQTQAVTYVVSRSMLLATMFYLSGIMFFAKAATAGKRKGLYIAGLFVSSLLGMASRENFATFPVMLVLYDLFFVSRFSLRNVLGNWKVHLPVFLSLGYLAYIVASNTYDRGTDYPGVGVPHADYFLTQFSVHWTYLRLLLLPVNQNLDYAYPIAGILFELPALLSFVGYLGLWGVGMLLARKRPVVSFPVLWFLVALIPISFAVTFMNLRLDDVIFEHRLYLPGTAFFALAGVAVVIAIKGLANERLRTAAVALAVIVPLLLATATFKRNSVWQSEISLWQDAAVKSPRKARPHNNLGDAYSKTRQFDRALEHLLTAVEMEPNYAKAHYNLGLVYENKNLPDNALEQYRTAIMLKPNYVAAHNNLGSALADLGRLDEAIEHFQAAVSFDPMDAAAHNNLGMAYRMKGLPDKSEEHFRIARELSRRK